MNLFKYKTLKTINIPNPYYSSTPINTRLSPSFWQLSISPVEEMEVVKLYSLFQINIQVDMMKLQ